MVVRKVDVHRRLGAEHADACMGMVTSTGEKKPVAGLARYLRTGDAVCCSGHCLAWWLAYFGLDLELGS